MGLEEDLKKIEKYLNRSSGKTMIIEENNDKGFFGKLFGKRKDKDKTKTWGET